MELRRNILWFRRADHGSCASVNARIPTSRERACTSHSLMRPTLHHLLLPLIVLLAILTAPLRMPAAEDSREEITKRRWQETLRLAVSSAPKDRILAVVRLDSLHDMDYELLWKLMNDSDTEVRIAAIQELRLYYFTKQSAPQVPAALAQKMIAMLEKEVTPERISAAFAPGHVKELPAGLAVISALTLNHIYEHHFFAGRAYDYLLWQMRVLLPLGIAMGRQSRDMTAGLEGLMGDLYDAINDPTALMEVLRAMMQGLDDPGLPPDGVQFRLRMLWSHRLLGRDGPLNLMLVAQLSPRLEKLTQRILGPMREGSKKEYAEQLINEITAAVLAAQEKLTLQPAKAVEK